MVEELSVKAFLDGFLPRILPDTISFQIIPHEGKSDLEKSIPRKLRGWREPNVRFIVIRDQDSGNCVEIKKKLQKMCEYSNRPETLIRIACRELEAWFIGDLETVAEVFDAPSISGLSQKSKYRNPDLVGTPSTELKKLIPLYGKVRGARDLGPHINLSKCRSNSFHQFQLGLKRIIEEADQKPADRS